MWRLTTRPIDAAEFEIEGWEEGLRASRIRFHGEFDRALAVYCAVLYVEEFSGILTRPVQ